MALFFNERIAASRDASGLIRLATHSAEPFQPTDLLRDSYVLEFTGLPERGELRSVIEQQRDTAAAHFEVETKQEDLTETANVA